MFKMFTQTQSKDCNKKRPDPTRTQGNAYSTQKRNEPTYLKPPPENIPQQRKPFPTRTHLIFAQTERDCPLILPTGIYMLRIHLDRASLFAIELVAE